MRNPTDNQREPNMQEVMRLAQSPAGQQLIAMLRQNGGDELKLAMAKAAAGDYTAAKNAISSLLDTPEGKALLEQFGR